ncbi:hypothetical protein ACFX15_043048 [Malus domestica]
MDQTATAAAVSGGDLREKIEASGLRAGVGAELGFVIAKGDKDNPDYKSKVHKLERSGSIHDLVRATEALPPGQNPVDHDDQTVDDDPSSTVLDLTNFQLHDLDSIELPPSLTKLDLTTNHLTSLDPQIATLSNKKKTLKPSAASLIRNRNLHFLFHKASFRDQIHGATIVDLQLRGVRHGDPRKVQGIHWKLHHHNFPVPLETSGH